MRQAAWFKGWRTKRRVSAQTAFDRYAYIGSLHNARRLIIAIHGRYGSIYEFVFTRLADCVMQQDFVVVALPNKLDEKEEFCERDYIEFVAYLNSLRAVDFSHVVLLGFSWGAHAVLRLALKYHQHFSGLILLSAAVASEKLHLMLEQSRALPPALLVHGEQDTVVPLAVSRTLAAQLANKRYMHDLLELSGATHTASIFDLREKPIASFLQRFTGQ